MIEQEIIDMTNQVFEESFEIEKEKLKPDMNIFGDLGLDSLDIVDLIVALQHKFHVRIRDDERVRDIRTLGDIYYFIMVLKTEGVVDQCGRHEKTH
jgi:acyl carrier protein